MEFLTKLKSILISPRFIAFYWSAGITAVVGFLNLFLQVIPDLGMPEIATALTVALIAQLTKALNNYKQNKPMGFAKR